MELFSIGQRAEGVIAIGQEATGIIAIGQIATGVFALGQFARGGIAIGQVAIGIFAVGMASLGLVGAIGMVGAGARGLGLILPLVPGPARRGKLPGLGSIEAIRRGAETGWLPIRIERAGDRLSVQHASGPIDATIAAGCREGAETAATKAIPELLGLFGPGSGKPELRRLMRVADERVVEGPMRWVSGAAQLALLAAACVVYIEAVAIPLGDFVIAALRELVTGS